MSESLQPYGQRSLAGYCIGYWNGLPCPPPGDLPDLGIEPLSLTFPALVGGFFTTSTTWEAPVGKYQIKVIQIFSKFKSYKVFNLYAEHIMRNAGLEETQAGIKIAGRNINNLRYADDTTLMAESEEELKSLLMKVKVESEKVGTAEHSENEDHGIQSHHFTGNRWGNSGNSVRLYFGGLQNHCRW